MILNVCIIGLGQVGIKFDLEESRSSGKEVWTHFTAYERLKNKYKIVAVVDPDKSSWKLVKDRGYEVEYFSTIEEFLNSEIAIDVVSICSPDEFHYYHLKEILPLVKGVFLEKPISLIEETDLIKTTLENIINNAIVYVNYYKRMDPTVQKMILSINHNHEKIKYIECRYSGPFMAVGSHAVDLLNFILPIKGIQSVLRHISIEGDGYSAMMIGCGDELINLSYTGKRHEFIFELDVVTDKSRYQLTENLIKYEKSRLVKSNKYSGYKEYFVSESESLENTSRFVAYLEKMYLQVQGKKKSSKNITKSIETQVLMKKILEKGQKHT